MSSEQLDAFERLKSCLAQATTLAFPSPDAQLSLTVNASKTAIGAVLNQGEGNHRQSLALFSKTLIPNQPASSSPSSSPSPAPIPVNVSAALSVKANTATKPTTRSGRRVHFPDRLVFCYHHF